MTESSPCSRKTSGASASARSPRDRSPSRRRKRPVSQTRHSLTISLAAVGGIDFLQNNYLSDINSSTHSMRWCLRGGRACEQYDHYGRQGVCSPRLLHGVLHKPGILRCLQSHTLHVRLNGDKVAAVAAAAAAAAKAAAAAQPLSPELCYMFDLGRA